MGKTLFKGLTAVLTAGVLAAGVCITGYVSRDPNSGDWFKDKDLANWAWNKSPADEGNTGDGGFEDDGNITTGATPSAGGAIMNEAVNSGGLALFSAAIPAAEFDTYGINPLADTAYTLTATITPAETDNKAVDYTVAWKDASSTWASGKSVSDYITVTQPTDGALTATLTCKQGFEEQIIITVTARDNPGNTATCTVDYAKRVTSKYTIANQLTLDGNTSGTKTWTWAQIPSGNIISPWHVPGTFSETYGVGTISNTVTSHSIEVSASAA